MLKRSSILLFLRLLVLDGMLRNTVNAYPCKQKINRAYVSKFGIKSISTIEKDISLMRFEFDAPIKYSRSNKGYFYSKEYDLVQAMKEYYKTLIIV